MGTKRVRGFKARDVLVDDILFQREIKKARLGNLITLLRAAEGRKLIENEKKITTLLAAIGKYHLDNPLKVDHREYWTMIEWARDLGWEVQHLDTGSGDYRSNTVAFERKEDDFSPSVYDRRLSRQLTAMREEAPFSFLVITKTWSEVKQDLAKRGVSEEVLIGIVASCCLSGYPPIFVGDGYDATRLMERIARKADEDRNRMYVPRPEKPSPKEYGIALVEALPGVGRTRAKMLLKHFGSVRTIANSTVEELCEVKGIGLGSAEKILGVFNYKV